MAAKTVYEEVESILTNRLRNALRTGEKVNAPDWVADLAACLALAVTLPDESEVVRLRAFAHEKLDEFVVDRLAARG